MTIALSLSATRRTSLSCRNRLRQDIANDVAGAPQWIDIKMRIPSRRLRLRVAEQLAYYRQP